MGNYHLRRSKHENNFTQISNEIFNLKVINKKTNAHKWISPQLLGIFCKLMTLKPGTNISAKMLADGFGIHIDTIRGYLTDLEKLGYLKTQMKQPIEGGYFTKHYFLQECITEKFLNDFYEPETEEQYNEDSEVMIPTFDNNFYIKRKLDGPENSVRDFQVGVENPSREIGLNGSEEKIGTGNPEPCITCNNNINNNNIIKNNIKKINALSSKEESACAVQGQSLNSNITCSSLTLENNKHNNMINGDADQVGSKSKKIKNKAQLHEMEKEKNGGNVSVSEMVISKVSDLSYTDNQLANMQRQMNVISAEQKDAKTKQSKRERQFTLVKDYIDKNVTDPELNEKWKQYALTLKEKGSLASKTQFIEIYNNAQIITDKDKMLECLSNSISHGWVGVYPTDKKDNKKKETEVVQQYTVPTPMKDRKIARDENGNPLLF